MNQEDFSNEEYKRVSSWSKEYDKNIVQIFGGMVVTYTSLMSALSAVLFKDGGKPILGAIYTFLAPTLIIVPAFRLMLSQRTEIVRMAAFVFVFFEEPSGIVGWEGALKRVRERKLEHNQVRSESNDPMTWTIWVCMVVCLSAFTYAIYAAYDNISVWFELPVALLTLMVYENPSTVLQASLERLLKSNESRNESNASLDWAVRACMFLYLVVFTCTVFAAFNSLSVWYELPGVLFWLIAAVITSNLHKRWDAVIPEDLPRYIREFQYARDNPQ